MKLKDFKRINENAEEEEFTTDPKAIKHWLEGGFGLSVNGTYKMSEDVQGIDIDGSFIIDGFNLEKLPFRVISIAPRSSFGIDVSIQKSQLNTLDGLPREISGLLLISECRHLKSLADGPRTVSKLALHGMPDNFDASSIPNITHSFSFTGSKTKSFEGFPQQLPGSLIVNNTKITSLKGLPRIVGTDINLTGCKIKSFVGVNELIDECGGNFAASWENVKTGGIGLLLIPGIKSLTVSPGMGREQDAFAIIKKYLGRPEDIFECQAELIEAGYPEFAEL